MKLSFSVVILALALALAATALAETSAEAFARLEATVKKDIEAHKNDGPMQNGQEARNTEQSRYFLSQLRPLIAGQEIERAEEVVNHSSQFLVSEDEQKELANLSAALAKERIAKQNVRAAEAEAIIKRAGEAVRTAKDPKELDAVMIELARFREVADDRWPGPARASVNKIRTTLAFVQRWQDYLGAVKSGNQKDAHRMLESALQNEGFDLIPRSEIVARLQQQPSPTDKMEEKAKRPEVKSVQIDEIVGKIKSLDDLPGAIQELKSLQAPGQAAYYGGDNDPLSGTINVLATIDRMYQEFKAGLPLRIEQGGLRVPPTVSSKTIPLKAQLLLLVLPRHLNVPSDLMPQPNESVDVYLERLIDEGKRRGDLPLMTKARDIERWLASGNYQGGMESPGLAFYSAGQNQEAAAQYMLAVLSYQNALKSGNDAVPTKVIGERLAALKTAHPQEFDQGMANFLNPQRNADPFGSRPGNYPPMPPGAAWPGMPQPQFGQPSPTVGFGALPGASSGTAPVKPGVSTAPQPSPK